MYFKRGFVILSIIFVLLALSIVGTDEEGKEEEAEIKHIDLAGLESGGPSVEAPEGGAIIEGAEGSGTAPAGAVIGKDAQGRVTASALNDFTTKTGTKGRGLINTLIGTDGRMQAGFASELSAPQSGTEMNDAAVVDVSADGRTISAQSASSIDIPAHNFFAANAGDISITPTGIHIGSSGELGYRGASTEDIINFDTDLTNTFTLGSADIVTIGNSIFKHISNAVFDVFNGFLVSADITSDKENNTFTLDNPIPLSSEKITITANESDTFHLNYTKLIDGKKAVEYSGSPTTVFQMGNISFVPDEGGKLAVVEGVPPNYIVTNGILNYTTAEFVEVLDTCSESNVFIDYAKGFKQLVLSPFTEVLCPGGRYSYINKLDKEKSYSVLNTGLENYEVGFNKAGLFPMDLFLKDILEIDKSYGYVSFPEFLLLNGVISYERYVERDPQKISLEDYNLQEHFFKSVYESLDNDNRATFTLTDGKMVGLEVSNEEALKVEANRLLLEANSGFHKITEVQEGYWVEGYHDFNEMPRKPSFITSFKASFSNGAGEEISFANGTMTKDCRDAMLLKSYTPGTPEERNIFYHKFIEINELLRYEK